MLWLKLILFLDENKNHIKIKMEIPRLIKIIIFLCLSTGTLYLLIWVSLKEILPLLEKEFTTFWILFPFLFFLSLGIITFLSSKINEILYTYIYIIVFTFFGHIVNSFTCCLTLLLIKLFTNINYTIELLLSIILPIILTIYGVINARNTKVEKITLHYPKLKGRKKTICHLSDLHLGAVYQREFVQKIVIKIKEIAPDVVVITGDMCDGSLKVKLNWLEPFDSLSIPILYITGNHEQIHGKDPMIEIINQTSIKHIGSEVFKFDNINFIGIDYEYNLKTRLIEIMPSNNSNPNILLCHVPQLKPKDLEKYNIFLFLAGHTHGGQIFPFHPFVIAANACFNGLYEENGHYVYVSPGVGSWGPPMRIGSHSTIGVINIEK